MKKILLWVWLGISCSAATQVVTVRDEQTNDLLEFVTLSSESPKAFAVTNAHGQAEISAFTGSKNIVIRSLGYLTEGSSYSELAAVNFEIELTPGNILMDKVIVSASRWNEVSSEVPGKVSVMSPKEIALLIPQTTADLLGGTGEIFIQKSQQGGGSPMVRGFATNRLLYTVDGVRMNTAIFRSGNVQNVISLDAFATEKAEVSFGPGSVIYGSDAIGGVMSFQTLTPQLSLSDQPLIKGSAVFRTSSANRERTGHFDFNLGWKRWALVTSFSANDFGDLKMGSYGPGEYLLPYYVQREDTVDVIISNPDQRIQKPTAYAQMNLMQKLRFVPGANWDMHYGFHYSETSDYGRYDRHISYENGLPRYGEWSYGPQKWMMNNLSIVHSRKNVIYDAWTLRLAHQYFEESRIDRDLNDTMRHVRTEKVDALSLNLDFIKTAGKMHKFLFGAEAVMNNVNSIGFDENLASGETITGPSRYPQALWSSYAAYLSYRFKASEKTFIQTGLRYSHFMISADFDTTFYPFTYTKASIGNGALTGSLGAAFRPTDKWALNVNFATAFRSPNVDDMGKVFDSEPGSVLVPNPDLSAEYAYNADLGMARTFGSFLKLDLTVFYTHLQNAMVRRDFTINGQDSILYNGTMSKVLAIQNAAVAQVFGLQAGLEIKLPKGFGFGSKLNYQSGEEELDDGSVGPSRHAAPMFGVSKITFSAFNLSFEFNVVYSAGKTFIQLPEEEKSKPEIYASDVNGNPHSPSWYTLNFKAMYKLNSHFTLNGGVENISDQRYRAYSSGMCGAGRNFILSIRAGF